MAKVAIVYWSGSGNTEAMAQAVEEGAKAAGAQDGHPIVERQECGAHGDGERAREARRTRA